LFPFIPQIIEKIINQASKRCQGQQVPKSILKIGEYFVVFVAAGPFGFYMGISPPLF
jgi:hypothetical protein